MEIQKCNLTTFKFFTVFTIVLLKITFTVLPFFDHFFSKTHAKFLIFLKCFVSPIHYEIFAALDRKNSDFHFKPLKTGHRI